mmetsp:Transcript_42651/g.79536  ORF Transcript_42651/g.79536 Transcript_42651/m.79536 type:complete len:105 (-) Transcript_42651:79-393(-)
MQGISLRHLASREIGDKLKCALQPGSFYMEAIAHMYVVNAPSFFSMAWKVVRNLISPWTASKITVSTAIPEELVCDLGGPESSGFQAFKEILSSTTGHVPVLRP